MTFVAQIGLCNLHLNAFAWVFFAWSLLTASTCSECKEEFCIKKAQIVKKFHHMTPSSSFETLGLVPCKMWIYSKYSSLKSWSPWQKKNHQNILHWLCQRWFLDPLLLSLANTWTSFVSQSLFLLCLFWTTYLIFWETHFFKLKQQRFDKT